MSFWIAAISLGLLGSFHCVGMCGPIALALPVNHLDTSKRILGLLLYNFGRALTYAFFGMVFGLLGQAFFMGGFQQVLSVLIGSVLLVSVILPSVFTSFKLRPFQNFSFRLKAGFQELFRRKGVSVLFLTGLMNGLLPCGLVYVALAAATSTGSFVQGAWFMLVFGMGTFPVMLALPLFGQVIKVKYRNQMRKIVPVVISLMAVLLILRGLNLGIPYVSPRIDRTNEAGALNCHEKTSDSGLSSDIPCGPHSKTQVLSKEENNNTSE